MYGQSSEADMASGQLTLEDFGLFNEAEALREPFNMEPKEEDVIKESAKQKRGKHKKNVDNLPVETIVYALSPEEQICEKCGSPLQEMKEVVRTEIVVEPAKVHVVKHVQKIYSCKTCDKKGESGIVNAPGIPITRNNLCHWSMKVANDYGKPHCLKQHMEKHWNMQGTRKKRYIESLKMDDLNWIIR